MTKNRLKTGVENHTESHACQPYLRSNLILIERMVICVGIAVTRLLVGCSRGIEEASWWKNQKYLKVAYGCLAIPR
jgi:hypothetical protein